MPITSKKQSQAKQDWLKNNSKVYGVRVMNNGNEKDLWDFLQAQDVPGTTIKLALREYMANHPSAKEFRYGMRLRGYSPGAQPKGVLRREDDPTGKYHDIIVYGRELSDDEIKDYELERLI